MRKKVTKKSISLLKNLNKPPQEVKNMMVAVNILFGEDNPHSDSWKSSIKLLKKINFFNMLTNYDRDGIDSVMVQKLRPIVESDYFSYENIFQLSTAAAPFVYWIADMYTFGVNYNNQIYNL